MDARVPTGAPGANEEWGAVKRGRGSLSIYSCIWRQTRKILRIYVLVAGTLSTVT